MIRRAVAFVAAFLCAMPVVAPLSVVAVWLIAERCRTAPAATPAAPATYFYSRPLPFVAAHCYATNVGGIKLAGIARNDGAAGVFANSFGGDSSVGLLFRRRYYLASWSRGGIVPTLGAYPQ